MGEEDKLEQTEEKKDDFYIVGVGASAGGLEALTQLFKRLPSNTGMAFVVIQHLSPDHDSHMVELLSKHTLMNICQAEDGMSIAPDSIYLIPPKNNMKVFKRRIYLTEREDNVKHLNLPIDIFFNTLAEDVGYQAIGVILSGTGSDGSRGLKSIKEKNGIVMVQSKTSAKFSGMPSNAINTGLVDFILEPDSIAEKLLEYIKHPYVSQKKNIEQVIDQEDFFNKVLAMIKDEVGVDFTYYKDNTIIRRLERRMIVNQIDEIKDYINYMKENSQEVETLYKELLIGVTRFFRDKEAFEILAEEIIPEIFADKEAGAEVRIWVTACSTGEEAYSMAILCKEFMERNDKYYDVKIFATDIDDVAIRKASSGSYPESVVADISTARLEKYFIKKSSNYEIIKDIRQMVIFSKHNLVNDPPFHKIDLLSCRNLLIYLEPVLQEKVLSFFHFALKENGFLFLGSSETIGKLDDIFTTINSKYRLYRSKGKDKIEVQRAVINSFGRNRFSNDLVKKKNLSSKKKDLSSSINRILLAKYVPDSAIINKDNELVHVIGNVNNYLGIPTNQLSLNIIQMCDNKLSTPLSVAINKVKRNQEQIVYNNIEFKNNNDAKEQIDLVVAPLLEPNLEQELIVVSFIDQSANNSEVVVNDDTPSKEYNSKNGLNQRVNDLERELGYTQENLQATIEELEASNEELQATNEELLASNEELQSSNEELESVNEELITVNSEHQNKIEELTRLKNDMDNLLKSTNIGTLFLDSELNIRKFTPVVKDYLNILEIDIGRPIRHISHELEYDSLESDATEVLETLTAKHKELKSSNGKWYLMKILPYRTDKDRIKGVVVTFVDITEIRYANEEIDKLSYVVDEILSMVVITDLKTRIKYVNRSFLEFTGYTKAEILDQKTNILQSRYTPKAEYKELWAKIKNKKSWQGELYNRTKDGKIYCEQANIFPILNSEGKITNYIKVASLARKGLDCNSS